LESLSGFNLFGKDGNQASIIHVISDDIARTRITLESLLPRESISKEVDAAALSIIGFPAFAVNDPIIRKKTEALIQEKLEGRYGCKRFLLDGHQTAIEDSQRLHYDPQELKQFMNIECEWPLFFTYLFLNNLCMGNEKLALDYRTKLDSLLVEQNGEYLLPELYTVPIHLISAEKENPNSQNRLPNENIPLVWAQSLFMLGCLIQDNLILIDDIDPLGRHKVIEKDQNYKLQIHLLAQDQEVKDNLTKYGIDTQTLAEIAPIQIREASELAEAYTHVGRNDRIGLTGRPLRQLRTLATSKIYKLAGEHLLFLPQCLSQKGFYLAMDNRLLVERLRLELSYIYKHWDREGNPLFVINIKKNMLDGRDGDIIIAFLKELQQGYFHGIPLQIGTILDFSHTSNHEKINYLHDFKFSKASWEEFNRPFLYVLANSDKASRSLNSWTVDAWSVMSDEALIEQLKNNPNLYAQLEVLTFLNNRYGLNYDTQLTASVDGMATVRNLLDEVYERAGDQHIWPIV
jgi:phosphorylase kinase alpha/beta subunit